MFGHTASMFPSGIKRSPIVLILHTSGSQQPKPENLGKLASARAIGFGKGGKRGETLQSRDEQLEMGWQEIQG